jgi:hypothetical protein
MLLYTMALHVEMEVLTSMRSTVCRQTTRELTGLTPRELGVSERSFKLGDLSDSDDDSDEALSASPSPAASPAPARTAGSRGFNPPPTGTDL